MHASFYTYYSSILVLGHKSWYTFQALQLARQLMAQEEEEEGEEENKGEENNGEKS